MEQSGQFLNAYFLPESRENLTEIVEGAFDIRLAYGDSSYYLDLYLYWPRLRRSWRDWFRKAEEPPFIFLKITPNGDEIDPEPYNESYSLDYWRMAFQLDGVRDHEVHRFLADINAEIET